MTAQDDFFEDNIAQAPAGLKEEMLYSVNYLLGLSELDTLTLDQVFATILETPGAMNTFLDECLVDDWTYVSTSTEIKETIDKVILYREQLRGVGGLRVVSPGPLNLTDPNINDLNLLTINMPVATKAAGLRCGLTLSAGRVLTSTLVSICEILEVDGLTDSQIYNWLMVYWPIKRYPLFTLNPAINGNLRQLQPPTVFQLGGVQAAQGLYENSRATSICSLG